MIFHFKGNIYLSLLSVHDTQSNFVVKFLFLHYKVLNDNERQV
jgi:hypothetical protein